MHLLPTLLCSLVLTASGTHGGGLQEVPQPEIAPAPAADVAATQLRKLHLVRPDLIPYPLAYEVYC